MKTKLAIIALFLVAFAFTGYAQKDVSAKSAEAIKGSVSEKAFMIDKKREQDAQIKEIKPDIKGISEKIEPEIKKRDRKDLPKIPKGD